MAKKTNPRIVVKILSEWDKLNGGTTKKEKEQIVAKKTGVVPATVRRYVSRRSAGKVLPDGRDVRGPLVWPQGVPMPKTVQRVNPCPSCNRIYIESYHQAVVIKTTAEGLAYLRCRACDHSFKLAYSKDGGYGVVR